MFMFSLFLTKCYIVTYLYISPLFQVSKRIFDIHVFGFQDSRVNKVFQTEIAQLPANAFPPDNGTSHTSRSYNRRWNRSY